MHLIRPLVSKCGCVPSSGVTEVFISVCWWNFNFCSWRHSILITELLRKQFIIILMANNVIYQRHSPTCGGMMLLYFGNISSRSCDHRIKLQDGSEQRILSWKYSFPQLKWGPGCVVFWCLEGHAIGCVPGDRGHVCVWSLTLFILPPLS